MTDVFAQNDLSSPAKTTQTEIREPIELFNFSTASSNEPENDSHLQEGQNVFHFDFFLEI